jgi:HPr Serine kinase C-terminal domain/AAA domain
VHSYRICGLSVASDIVLPGLIAGEPDSIPEVTIRYGEVPQALPDARMVGPTWQIAGKQFLLSVPNVARFLLKNGDQIVFAPESEASAEDVPIFILGTVFGILLHQREQIVLHASAIEVNGRAVAFCGASGAGKSTLAAALAQRGYRLLTDDVCAITLSSKGTPMVHPDGRQLKLWAEAIEKLQLQDLRRARVSNRIEKFYVDLPDARSEPLAVSAIYVLREAMPSLVWGVERANVVDAAVLLRNNAYRPLLVASFEQNEGYFRAAAQIASRSGIFILTRPRDFAAVPQVVSWLERHWRDLGVMEQAA